MFPNLSLSVASLWQILTIGGFLLFGLGLFYPAHVHREYDVKKAALDAEESQFTNELTRLREMERKNLAFLHEQGRRLLVLGFDETGKRKDPEPPVPQDLQEKFEEHHRMEEAYQKALVAAEQRDKELDSKEAQLEPERVHQATVDRYGIAAKGLGIALCLIGCANWYRLQKQQDAGTPPQGLGDKETDRLPNSLLRWGRWLIVAGAAVVFFAYALRDVTSSSLESLRSERAATTGPVYRAVKAVVPTTEPNAWLFGRISRRTTRPGDEVRPAGPVFERMVENHPVLERHRDAVYKGDRMIGEIDRQARWAKAAEDLVRPAWLIGILLAGLGFFFAVKGRNRTIAAIDQRPPQPPEPPAPAPIPTAQSESTACMTNSAVAARPETVTPDPTPAPKA